MTSPRHFRRSPRLLTFDYTGTYVYNLGTVTRLRHPLLRDSVAAGIAVHALEVACAKYAFTAIAYCIMPNHIHLLAASDIGLSVRDFMRHFKQISGYEYKQRYGDHLWQTSYYDHVVRVKEAIEPIAKYIWHNPVRAGIAATLWTIRLADQGRRFGRLASRNVELFTVECWEDAMLASRSKDTAATKAIAHEMRERSYDRRDTYRIHP